MASDENEQHKDVTGMPTETAIRQFLAETRERIKSHYLPRGQTQSPGYAGCHFDHYPQGGYQRGY
ncbi:MAG: hypothetical protein ACR2PX_12355 [Endozoicomonas sp.]|uniref:hypothetical protein n=1 Tax=Endozoicomonas sp. TaxID=1892382 RepID=UPI003D9B1DEA